MNKALKVILNIGTHGNERIGLKVAHAIKKLRIKNGELAINIANERAFKLNQRFIDQDLNRSFPGNKSGNYEERRAYKLLPGIRAADVVLDIHSTTSELRNALIVTKINKKIREYIKFIAPKYVLILKATKNKTLISHAKIGLAFEYGKDNDPKVVKRVTDAIQHLLSRIGMIDHAANKIKPKHSTFFDVYKTVPKPAGAKLNQKIKNYKLIKRGQIYATVGGRNLKARQNFYPILFGQKNYDDIFGFAANRVT